MVAVMRPACSQDWPASSMPCKTDFAAPDFVYFPGFRRDGHLQCDGRDRDARWADRRGLHSICFCARLIALLDRVLPLIPVRIIFIAMIIFMPQGFARFHAASGSTQ